MIHFSISISTSKEMSKNNRLKLQHVPVLLTYTLKAHEFPELEAYGKASIKILAPHNQAEYLVIHIKTYSQIHIMESKKNIFLTIVGILRN